MSILQREVNSCVPKTIDTFTCEIDHAYKVGTQLINKRIQRSALLVTFPQN